MPLYPRKNICAFWQQVFTELMLFLLSIWQQQNYCLWNCSLCIKCTLVIRSEINEWVEDLCCSSVYSCLLHYYIVCVQLYVVDIHRITTKLHCRLHILYVSAWIVIYFGFVSSLINGIASVNEVTRNFLMLGRCYGVCHGINFFSKGKRIGKHVGKRVVAGADPSF